MTARRSVAVAERPVVPFRGLEPGDPVKVRGLRGAFVYMGATADADGTVTCVTVNGGANGRRLTRSVAPDRVVIRRKRPAPS